MVNKYIAICMLKEQFARRIGIYSLNREVPSKEKEDVLVFLKKKFFINSSEISSVNLFISKSYFPVLINRWKSGRDF
jgi:hypothetical protein